MAGQGKLPSDIDLMLLRDGELGAAEAQRVMAAIAEDDSARDKLTVLDQISETVRTVVELDGDDAASALDGMWDRVQRRIDSNGQSAPSAAVAPRSASSVVERLVRWFEEYRAHLVTGSVTAAAVAVAMLLTRPQAEVRIVKVPVQSVKVHEPTLVLQPQAPEVENLEVYDGSGTILTLPDDDGEGATSVIWLSSDETEPTEGPL